MTIPGNTLEEQKERWDELLYPGTQTLRNKFRETDYDTLEFLTDYAVAAAWARIPQGGFGFSSLADELSKTHEVLFSEVFDWAGHFRDVPMTKQGVSFAPWTEVVPQLEALDEYIRSSDWDNLAPEEVQSALADVHTELNIIHPFREGNGRATRAVMGHLADQNGFNSDWEEAGPALNMVSAVSAASPRHSEDSLMPMRLLYAEIATPVSFNAEESDFRAGQEILSLVEPAAPHSTGTPEHSANSPAEAVTTHENGDESAAGLEQ